MSIGINPTITIVLVEPQGPINVGAVCRLMMNFGLEELRLVSPCQVYRSLDARRMALKAESILNRASLYPTLADALADCHLSFGTTRRFGKYRETFLSPEAAAEQALRQPPASRVAFVFGREDRGLHTSELDLCHRFVTIPTAPAYPSMNLSHAVGLFCYELGKQAQKTEQPSDHRQLPARTGDIESMFQHMRQTLLMTEFLDPQNPDHILRAFRRMLGRSGLSDRDVRILQGLWSRIDWIEGDRRRLAEKRDRSRDTYDPG